MPGSARAQGATRWGWHPLDDRWASRIVAAAAVRPGELVLDVGAGKGALTAHLVEAGAVVIAIELHPGRAALLRERFAGAPVTVVQADAASLRLPHRPFRVVANPPFAGSSALLRIMLGRHSGLVAADVVLQRAVVRRYVEGRAPGAERWQRQYEVSAGMSLPRTAFRPAPTVDARVLVVRRRGSRSNGSRGNRSQRGRR